MAINLEKGQKINLSKSNGPKLTNFCVGCNWGAIVQKGFFSNKVIDVDLDLSTVLVDNNGEFADYIYSPLYRPEFLEKFGLPNGKLTTVDDALHHSGDDTQGDTDGDDNLDNEIITVDLNKVDPKISQIFFFLNICSKDIDFAQIPYVSIRMYEGTPSKVKEVFAQYNVNTDENFAHKTAIIMGKLYRRNGEWKFSAIGDAYDDPAFPLTIARILQDYTK